MRKILGLMLVMAVAGMLVGCETTTPEIKTTSAQPENLSIQGIVTGKTLDNDSWAVLSGAVITLAGQSTTRTTVSDANGEYAFNDLPDGTYVVIATKEGYQNAVSPSFSLDPMTTDNPPPDNTVTTYNIDMCTNPIVLSISPAPGITLEASSQVITVKFNETIDQSSVRPILASQGLRTYAIADTQTLTTSWSADSKILYITTGGLLPNQVYRLQVDPNATAKDADGNILDIWGGVNPTPGVINSGGGGLRDYTYNSTVSEKYYRTASGGVPGAPSNLCITLNDKLPADADYADVDGGGEDVKGHWDTPISGEISGYRAYVSLSTSGPWSLLSQVTSGSNYFVSDVDGVHLAIFGTENVDPVCYNKWAFVNNKIYFKVVAFNGEGESSAATAEAQEAIGPVVDGIPDYFGDIILNNNYYLPDVSSDITKTYIAFKEPVNLTDAANAANYDLGPVINVESVTVMTSSKTPLGGNFSANAFTVVLIDADANIGQGCGEQLTVNNIRDLAGNSIQVGPSLNVIYLN